MDIEDILNTVLHSEYCAYRMYSYRKAEHECMCSLFLPDHNCIKQFAT